MPVQTAEQRARQILARLWYDFASPTGNMIRATSAFLVITAAALLVTWGVSPAESQQARPTVPAPVAIEFPAELAEVNAEVERLSAQVERAPELPDASRDPFNFAPRVRAPREIVPVSQPVASEPVVVPPSWPSLVAIMTRASDGAFEVALADRADALHVVTAGASVGAFIVSEVTADFVVVSDPSSGLSTRLTVR